MRLRLVLIALVLTAGPATAHLKFPKEPPAKLVKRSPGSPAGVLYYTGYAHIDFNWLWDWTNTLQTWDGTASTAYNLMFRYPNFHFGLTQAAAYIEMERLQPALFANVQSKVTSGQWSLLGGLWDESDTNLAGEEGLARSFLYAQNYFHDKFGKQPQVGFLPDSFGHTAQLPQIMSQVEIPNYYFQRCVPAGKHLFWWQAPDGTRVLAYASPGWYNEAVTKDTQTNWPSTINAESGVNMAMVVFGVGDHGGGPTIADLTNLDTLKTDPTFPEIREAAPEDFYAACRAAEPSKGFPVWNSEMQYTFEGCYTSHGDVKRAIRDSENELYATEALAALASLYGMDYPADDLRAGWRASAYYEFHDIACGTAIHTTYAEIANRQKLVKQTAAKVARNSWSVLEPHVDTTGSGQPLVLFNPLAWSHTDVIEATLPFAVDTPYLSVTDSGNAVIPSQITGRETRDGQVFISFVVLVQVPGMGYKVLHVLPSSTAPVIANPLTVSNNVVTTQQFIVNVDPATGQVSRLYDRNAKIEVLPTGQNALRLALLPEDPGNDAWTIRQLTDTGGSLVPPTYLDAPVSFEVLETGPVRARFRAVYKSGSSTYTQEILAYAGVPRVDAHLTVDFHDYNVLVKSVIPTSLSSPSAYFDVPFYAVNRPTDGHVDVPMQKWMDLSQGTTYGLSVLNDCKYGADVNGSVMRLSLLRGTHSPDATGDAGTHLINYALYPHPGDWRRARTTRFGYEFNVPIRVMPSTVHTGNLGPSHSFVATYCPNTVVTAFKRAEDGNGYILRYYETDGNTLTGGIALPKTVVSAAPVNMLEHPQSGSVSPSGSSVTVTTQPYRIQTMRIGF